MTKSNIFFIIAGLGISLFLAAFISPFTSSSPDGLEKVAEQKGFLEKAEKEGVTVWGKSPIADYTVPGIKNELVTTGLAGVIGTVIVFIVGFIFTKVVIKKREISKNN